MNSTERSVSRRGVPDLAWIVCAILLASCSNKSDADTDSSIAEPTTKIFSLPEGTLGLEHLDEFAREISSESLYYTFPGDRKALHGRSFKVSVPNVLIPITKSVNWDYDHNTQILTISVSPSSAGHFPDVKIGNKSRYLIVQHGSYDGKREARSNAFGATVLVTPQYSSTLGIGSWRERDIGIFRSKGKGWLDYEVLEKKFEMASGEVQKFVEGITLEVEGEVLDEKDQPSVICSEENEEATFSYPYENHERVCVVQARFTKIAIRSDKLGRIAEWVSSSRSPDSNSQLQITQK